MLRSRKIWRSESNQINTFASLAGKSIVVVSWCFIATHHTQLILTSALSTRTHPGPPPHWQSYRSEALSKEAPTVGLGARIARGLQAVRAVVVWWVAELRGRGGGGGRGGRGGWRTIVGEGQVGRTILLLAVWEELEVRVLQGIAQGVSQHIWNQSPGSKVLTGSVCWWEMTLM